MWAGLLIFSSTTINWIIPCFWNSGCILHVEHVSCVVTNFGQHQWVIRSRLSIGFTSCWITGKLLSLSLDLFFKILLFQVAFLIFFFIAIFSLYFLLVGLWLYFVALFQSGNYYNMTVWILAGNYIGFTIAAGLIRLHMPGVKKSRV